MVSFHVSIRSSWLSLFSTISLTICQKSSLDDKTVENLLEVYEYICIINSPWSEYEVSNSEFVYKFDQPD